jgi:hypothetical protein
MFRFEKYFKLKITEKKKRKRSHTPVIVPDSRGPRRRPFKWDGNRAHAGRAIGAPNGYPYEIEERLGEKKTHGSVYR